MTLSLPPSYVPLPVEIIEQAYKPDKPHRALFTSFIRLLALAWQNKYEHTPRLREEELYNTKNPDGSTHYGFLKLSRREYFEQKRQMELLGWLRSSRPATDFVQFSFSRAVAPEVPKEGSAENRTPMQKTAPLQRIEEEEDSLKLINTDSSSSSSSEEVRKTALSAEKKMQALIENLHLVFEPSVYGLLEMRDIFLAGIPERALGWIAKAYQDRSRLVNGGGAIGLIVKHVTQHDAPHKYFLAHYPDILPEAYLEAVGEIEYECDHCQERFDTRQEKNEHQHQKHPFPCSDCELWFLSRDELTTHWNDAHDPYRVKEPEEHVVLYAKDESVLVPINGRMNAEQAWQSVLGQLQMEMPRASFDTWVKHSRAVRFHGNTLEIGVHNLYARDWLESRIASTVSRLLVGILNQSVAVVFVVGRDGDGR